MRDRYQERARLLACYILRTDCTIREAARHFGLSKSTVHTDLTVRLPQSDPLLFEQIGERMRAHFEIKHLRGGESTKRIFSKRRAARNCACDDRRGKRKDARGAR